MWRRNEEGDCRRGMADEAMPLLWFKWYIETDY
jgi:hypothetical protein